MPCPNTSILKRGQTAPVSGFSFFSKVDALRIALANARAVAESQANTWLATKDGNCPVDCKVSKPISIYPKSIGALPLRKEWVVFWGGILIPLPLPFLVWKTQAHATWEARYICADPSDGQVLTETEEQ